MLKIYLFLIVAVSGCVTSKPDALNSDMLVCDKIFQNDLREYKRLDCIDSVTINQMLSINGKKRYYILKFYMKDGTPEYGHRVKHNEQYCGGSLFLVPTKDSLFNIQRSEKLGYNPCGCLSQADSILMGRYRSISKDSKEIQITAPDSSYLKFVIK